MSQEAGANSDQAAQEFVNQGPLSPDPKPRLAAPPVFEIIKKPADSGLDDIYATGPAFKPASPDHVISNPVEFRGPPRAGSASQVRPILHPQEQESEDDSEESVNAHQDSEPFPLSEWQRQTGMIFRVSKNTMSSFVDPKRLLFARRRPRIAGKP